MIRWGVRKQMTAYGISGGLGFRRVFFFSSRRRHTRLVRDWSSDVCSSDLSRCDHRSGLRQTAAQTGPGPGAAGLLERSSIIAPPAPWPISGGHHHIEWRSDYGRDDHVAG